MREYSKIQSIFKRDEKTHKFVEGDFSLPEIEYLQGNIWTFTEKIDGTNVRVFWNHESGEVSFGGRTANAQMPVFLCDKLNDLFPSANLREWFPETSICLYGEGYGARIQKGGGNYIAGGVSFILFDVLVGDWWLRRDDVEDIAAQLKIDVVPVISHGTIQDAVDLVKSGLKSTFGDFIAEGLVLKPSVDLFSRMGHRIITKVKHKDF